MAALIGASLLGLTRLALGMTEDGLPVIVNAFWATYDVVCLSAVLDAVTYQPDDAPGEASPARSGGTAAEAHGRA